MNPTQSSAPDAMGAAAMNGRRAFFLYAGVALVVTVVAVLALGVVSGAGPAGLAGVAALAWGVQLAAFGGLVALRQHRHLLMLGWAGGIVLRFLALAAAALWVALAGAEWPALRLLTLVGLLFVLALLEPVFYRRGLTA